MKELFEKYQISKSFYNRYFELNAKNRLGFEILNFINSKKGEFINPLKKDEYIKNYIKEEIENFFKKQEINIPQIEFCLTTRCTLKCKNCCALIPKFNEIGHIDMSFGEFQQNLNDLLFAVNSIRKLIILGGEPLLNPYLAEMLEYAAKNDKVKHICIISNGTMIPQINLIEVLKKYPKITFYMSNYSKNPDLASILKYNEIKNILKENGLKYQMMENWRWFIEYGFSCEKFDENISKEKFNLCHRAKCMHVLNRKIDICSKSFSGRLQGKVKCRDFIDLNKTKNLKKDLIDFYRKELFETCKYCILSNEEVLPGVQA